MAKSASFIVATLAAVILALCTLTRIQNAAAQQLTPIINFPNSGAAAAQPAFLKGMVALDNFAFHTAASDFRVAEKIDSGFALAYWGEAMTHVQLVWGNENVAAGRRVLQKERKAVDPHQITAHEQNFIDAARALFGPGNRVTRGEAFEKKMQALHRKYPNDFQAAAFYALALIRRGPQLGPAPVSKRMHAAAILEKLYRRNPRNPGAVHFLLHALDDPVHARLALPYARAYERIAKHSPHALHMPSHIYLRLGLWDGVAHANARAYAASLTLEYAADGPNFHALEWLHFARLQQGRLADAEKLLQTMRGYAATGNATAARAVTRMAARATIVAKAWRQALMPQVKPYLDMFLSYPNALYATGISAVERGDYAAANNIANQILSLRAPALNAKLPSWAQRMDAMANALEGLNDWRNGKRDVARSLFTDAIRASDALDSNLAAGDQSLPDPIKPVHELYGEVLFHAGDAATAAAQFSAVLKRFPRRPASLLGLARALAASGDQKDASCRYAELAAIWHKADAAMPGLSEVRREAAGARNCPTRDSVSRTPHSE